METNLQKKIKNEHRIMKILKVSELRYSVAQTNLGPVEYMIRYGDDKYHFLLDSTPLSDGTDEGKEKNEKMLEIFNLK